MANGMAGFSCEWPGVPTESHATGTAMPATPAMAAHPAMADPWEAALQFGEGTVIALLTKTEGAAYRNIGTAMAIAPDGRFAGAITSGCIEADLVLRAADQRLANAPTLLRYGEGSPFFDLRLPCGGAAEITLFTLHDMPVLQSLSQARAARQPTALLLSPDGRLSLTDHAQTGFGPNGFLTGFLPPLRFVIFGAGPEALVFASLVNSMGYGQTLLSHADNTLDIAAATGLNAQPLGRMADIARLGIDAHTAALLFYHDHDYEPEILQALLQTPAFYIGAQGSRNTQRNRLARLSLDGVADTQLARIHGPIGLIHSTRDPQALAISVMAEVMQYDAATV
ncbi:exported xanthine dehydrogenase/CoxI family protein [Ketogulonicigenium robustum]|uniref:Exported xanthine dehydrogenase/CoxI family protein n=1 Tax=Ketogulonicigenium robustum TaxID=92947 RepID=A0A1W6NW49_9RHOB|nr:XdhC family protein [Ketogulonicigenium robustum]ARO13445.1 exported xanthine dehydrogenase/CoxI family protein [Ketogulonicigenium robustum]